MRWKTFILASALVSVGSLSAMAGEAAYSANDIVKFFNEQQKTRKICVGTEDECGFADKKPAGFNLRLTFEKNSATLTDEAKSNLSVFAEALKSDSLKSVRFSIEGYTDATGSDTYNLGLSEKRANSVVAYLSGQGIDKALLEAKGLGKASPLNGNPLDPANRRVETRLLFQQ